MSNTVITIRLDSDKRDIVKGKCEKARISMNQLFERLCDLIINDSILVNESGITLDDGQDNVNADSMQIALIEKRLSEIECRLNADFEIRLDQVEKRLNNQLLPKKEEVKKLDTTNAESLVVQGVEDDPNQGLNYGEGIFTPEEENKGQNGDCEGAKNEKECDRSLSYIDSREKIRELWNHDQELNGKLWSKKEIVEYLIQNNYPMKNGTTRWNTQVVGGVIGGMKRTR